MPKLRNKISSPTAPCEASGKAIDKLPVWKQYYTDALAALKKEDNSRRVDRNTTVQEP